MLRRSICWQDYCGSAMAESAALTPKMLLTAYANGYFPMALDKDDPELYWFSPTERGLLPIAEFNIPRGLRRAMKSHPFTMTVDQDFEGVIRACGTLTKGRKDTWINDEIIRLYTALHGMGHAHSIETRLDGTLVGGLYGVSIGGAFFGESMFSRAPEASKIALVTLVEILAEAGYALLDTQYVNEHLLQFGVQAVKKRRYLAMLEKALSMQPDPSAQFLPTAQKKGLA